MEFQWPAFAAGPLDRQNLRISILEGNRCCGLLFLQTRAIGCLWLQTVVKKVFLELLHEDFFQNIIEDRCNQ